MIKEKGNKGFSIIEIVFAVGIVSFTFVGMMSLFAYNLRAEMKNRDRITAAYLAQEAIEVVRQKRDNNWNDGLDPWSGIDRGNGNVIIYNTDANNPSAGWAIGLCNLNNEAKKKIYLYNGNYVQENSASTPTGWGTTPFTRSILIDEENDGYNDGENEHRIKITVTVGYGTSTPLVVTSYLFDDWNN